MLASVVTKPEVVIGGGRTEKWLAGCVRARARQESGSEKCKIPALPEGSTEFHPDVNYLTRVESLLNQEAVEIFASSLEEVASTITPLDVRMELFREARETQVMDSNTRLPGGVDLGLCLPEDLNVSGLENGSGSIVSASGVDALSATHVLDFLPAKLEALHKAVETACVVLRIIPSSTSQASTVAERTL